MPLAHNPRFVTLLSLALAILAQASCFNDADVYTATTEVTDEGDVIQKPRLVSIDQLRQEAKSSGPRARVDRPVHNFGRLGPLTTHEHTFVIRNDGDQPLELTEGPTTCKCTVAHVTNDSVPPGGKAYVKLQWNTGRDTEYSHSATIFTNDPHHRLLRLRIKGQVQVLLRCEPAELVFSRVAPGETPSASTLVYSQVWDQFHLSKVTPNRPRVTYAIEEATIAEKRSLRAKTAYRLTVTLPDDLSTGYFTIPIHLTAQRDATSRSPAVANHDDADCELMAQGKVLRRLSVYGPNVDAQGTIMMGRLPQGRGAHIKLLLKLRDEQRDLAVRSIETVPDSLQVRIEPYQVRSKKNLGLFHLYVTLPKDAPTFRLPPNKRGHLRIEFDHPRASCLDLSIDLIVTPRADLERGVKPPLIPTTKADLSSNN